METLPWLLIAVAVILLLLLVTAILLKKKFKTPTDYYSLFIIGIVWVIIGLPSFFAKESSYNGLSYIGLVFLIIGLANKSKWKENRITWDKLNPTQKKLKIAVISILGVLLLAGLIAYFYMEAK